MAKWKVKTQDVDGGGTRSFKTQDGARKRFEEMVGYSAENAIAEQFYRLTEEGKPLPKLEEVKVLRAVSMFGTVVTMTKVDS